MTAARRMLESAPARAGLLLLLAALSLPSVLLAQSQQRLQHAGGRVPGHVHGRIVDAHSGAPLAGVAVRLRAVEAEFELATLTDDGGEYRFERVPAGAYLVDGSIIGYRAFSLEVDVAPGAQRRLSVGLVMEPVRLPELILRAPQPPPFLRVEPREAVPAMLAASEDVVTATWPSLALDAEEITFRALLEGVTPGEPDLFRALQRLPSVTTRNDYTAEAWIRGAPWQEARVFFDGVPVFNPLQGLGSFSGIGPAGVGEAVFHPGVRPAAIGEGAAGAVDLRSRRGSSAPRAGVRFDVSVVTTGVAADQELLDGRVAWMLSARRSYLDWLTQLAGRLSDDPQRHIPYSFGDAVFRIDARPAGAHEVEGSIFQGRDRLRKEEGADARWGNGVLRLSHVARLDRVAVRHTLGASRTDGTFASIEPATSALPVQGEATATAIGWDGFTGEFTAATLRAGIPVWSAGYQVARQHTIYSGPEPLPLPRPLYSVADEARGSAGLAALTAAEPKSAMLRLGAVWLDHFRHAGPVAVQAGLRAEGGDKVAGSGPVRLAPRISARFEVLPRVTFSAGLSRTWQYAQAVAPAGVHLAGLSSSYYWVLAGAEVPALRADLVTLGTRLEASDAVQLAAHAFLRSTGGVLIPDPRAGPLFDRQLQPGRTIARGVELSARARRGMLQGAGAYTLSQATTEAAGLHFPAAADRRHAGTLTGSVRPHDRWTGSLAFTAASGIAFTRIYGADVPCGGLIRCEPGPIPWASDPNGARAPRHARMDLLALHSTTAFGGAWDIYAQVLNVLGRTNRTFYSDVVRRCDGATCEAIERVERGVPRLLVLGSTLRW